MHGPLASRIHPLSHSSLHLPPLIRSRYEQARQCFDFLVEEDPADLNLLLLRAGTSAYLQDWDSALTDLDWVLWYDAYNVQVLLTRARIRACARDFTGAQEDYDLVLKYNPDDPYALAGYADVVQVRLAFEILILHCTKLHCTTTDILSPLLTIVFVVCSLSLALR